MARYARQRADIAAWSVGSIYAAELEAFDQGIYKALSEAGGSYILDDTLFITGNITPTQLNGNWSCTGIPTASGWIGNSFEAAVVQGHSFSAFQQFIRAVPPDIRGPGLSADDWRAATMSITQHTVTGAVAVWMPIQPPPGAILDWIKVTLDAGVHTGLPDTMPTASLVRRYYLDGTQSQIGTTIIDSSASTTVYESPHDITLTLTTLNHTVSSDYWYYVKLTGEAGTNSIADSLSCFGIRYAYSMNYLTNPG